MFDLLQRTTNPIPTNFSFPSKQRIDSQEPFLNRGVHFEFRLSSITWISTFLNDLAPKNNDPFFNDLYYCHNIIFSYKF
jgi:hypothetical protein